MTLGECEIELYGIQVQLERHNSYSDPLVQASYKSLAQAIGQLKACRTGIDTAIKIRQATTKRLMAEGKL